MNLHASNEHAEPVLTQATRDKLASVGTANIANALLKRGLRRAYMLGVAPLSQDQAPMVGPAFTLRFIPSREDIDTMANYSRPDNVHRRAVEECPPGHVLVIDTDGSSMASSAGDLMAARMKKRGVAGVVTDGGFRDTPAIRKTGLPAYQQRAAPPATPIAMHPSDLNLPIGCCGVAVYPGDIVVGDGDGVVVIPRHLADEVADEAVGAAEYEAFAELQIGLGRTIFEVFPATPESRREYDGWVAAGRPSLEESK
jgi:regulator of RNase E activity RraA